MRKLGRRQLIVVLALLGLWLPGAALSAQACVRGACRDDCSMHRLVVAHQMSASECGTRYAHPALAVPCSCGELHSLPGTAPATLTAAADLAQPDTAAFTPAVLSAAAPQTPFFVRFLAARSAAHVTTAYVPVSLGLRAPPLA